MLDALKFVQGAIAKKDFIPALTHFHISGGFVRGYNGKIALCAPIDLDIDATPKAVPFVKAIETCKDDETVRLHVTPKGRLSIKSSKFRALVECTEEPYPNIEPEGEHYTAGPGFKEALATLRPFIAEDASRPWSRGILVDGNMMRATNNIVLIEHWLDDPFPMRINIPKSAVDEIIRVKGGIESVQVAANSTTFHFPDKRWIKCQLLDHQWPELDGLLPENPQGQQPVDDTLLTALETVAPFCDDLDRVYLGNNGVMTALAEEYASAKYETNPLPEACFNVKQLMLVCGVANTINFELFPKPCPFFGNLLRGVIIGMRTSDEV